MIIQSYIILISWYICKFCILTYSIWTDPCNRNWYRSSIRQTDLSNRWSHHVTTVRSIYFMVSCVFLLCNKFEHQFILLFYICFIFNKSFVILPNKTVIKSITGHRSVSDQSVNSHRSVKPLCGLIQGLYVVEKFIFRQNFHIESKKFLWYKGSHNSILQSKIVPP